MAESIKPLSQKFLKNMLFNDITNKCLRKQNNNVAIVHNFPFFVYHPYMEELFLLCSKTFYTTPKRKLNKTLN